MRALESLIKKHGGLNKIKKMNFSSPYNKMFTAIIERAVGKSEKSRIDNEMEIFDLFEELTLHIIDAYEKIKKEGKSKMCEYPLCMCVALGLNMACHEFEKEHLKNYELYLNNAINEYKKYGEHALDKYFTDPEKIQIHPKGVDVGFTWDDSPEGWFWEQVYETLEYDRKLSITMFDDFIKAHPECEKEINEFYKK